jgi:hypothetical protein
MAKASVAQKINAALPNFITSVVLAMRLGTADMAQLIVDASAFQPLRGMKAGTRAML